MHLKMTLILRAGGSENQFNLRCNKHTVFIQAGFVFLHICDAEIQAGSGRPTVAPLKYFCLSTEF